MPPATKFIRALFAIAISISAISCSTFVEEQPSGNAEFENLLESVVKIDVCDR